MPTKKHPDSVLIAEYHKLKSVWAVGKSVGMSGQQVHDRLQAAGIDTSNKNVWTDEQISVLKEWYSRTDYRDIFDLSSLAALVGKHRSNVCRKARQLGLTDNKRTSLHKKEQEQGAFFGLSKEEVSQKMSESRKNWYKDNDHPRGMLGKTHSESVKFRISMNHKRLWDSMSKTQKEDRHTKAAKTRADRNTPPTMRIGESWKCGWREVGGQRFFARSRWEANIARYFEFLRVNGKIKAWKHEPVTFWFEKIRRGVRSYKPDFLITNMDGSEHYCEVKGWMDSRSRTTLKRMRIYHPTVKIDLIDGKRYKVLNSQCKSMIAGWEIGKI